MAKTNEGKRAEAEMDKVCQQIKDVREVIARDMEAALMDGENSVFWELNSLDQRAKEMEERWCGWTAARALDKHLDNFLFGQKAAREKSY
jgi:hypothetical protein